MDSKVKHSTIMTVISNVIICIYMRHIILANELEKGSNRGPKTRNSNLTWHHRGAAEGPPRGRREGAAEGRRRGPPRGRRGAAEGPPRGRRGPPRGRRGPPRGRGAIRSMNFNFDLVKWTYLDTCKTKSDENLTGFNARSFSIDLEHQNECKSEVAVATIFWIFYGQLIVAFLKKYNPESRAVQKTLLVRRLFTGILAATGIRFQS